MDNCDTKVTQEETPYFSIITPTFNCAAYIDRSYRCLCAQGVQDWEWIVVDDGSTDNTQQILDKLSQVDKRVKVFTLPKNEGRGYARNFALRSCRGLGVVIWDVDDIYLPSRLSCIKNSFDEGYDFFCSYALIVDVALNIKGARHFPTKNEGIFPSFVHPTLALKSSLLARVGYDENMRAGEDLALMIDLENNFRGYYCDQYLMLYVEDREINLNKTISMHKNHEDSLKKLLSSGFISLSSKQRLKLLLNLRFKYFILHMLRISPNLYLKSVSFRQIDSVISSRLTGDHILLFKEFEI